MVVGLIDSVSLLNKMIAYANVLCARVENVEFTGNVIVIIYINRTNFHSDSYGKISLVICYFCSF